MIRSLILWLICSCCLSLTNAHARPTEAVLPPTQLYVADPVLHRILQMDDLSGKNLRAFGQEGAGRGQFQAPLRLWVDGQKRIYICDTDNHRLVRMDDITGKGWTTLGTRGASEREFQFPVSVWVEDSGRITVLDRGNSRIVQMEDFTGKNWRCLPVEGLSGWVGGTQQHSQSWMMPNVVVDKQGRLYYPMRQKGEVVRVDDIGGKNPVILHAPPQEMRGGFPNFNPEQLGLDAAQRLYILSAPGYVTRVEDMAASKGQTLIGSAWISGISVSSQGDLYMSTLLRQLAWRQEPVPGRALFHGTTPWHDVYDKRPSTAFNDVSFFVR